MRTLLSLLLVAALSVPALAAPTATPVPRGRFVPCEGQQLTFDIGLRLVAVPSHRGSGMFAMGELLGTGSRDEVKPGHSVLDNTASPTEDPASRVLEEDKSITVYDLKLAPERVRIVTPAALFED